jgi:two-component system osmolarity sensor histidine kinase EnvZ
VLRIVVPRQRVSASNPHQLLVLMIGTGILMTLIAFLFLRNQLRPIKRLARAAEAFGRGQSVPFKPTGAIEVRAAGNAFLNMRARIDRHIEQRTLMLLGVSHDIRTPLTRLKLGLSMLDQTEDTEALQQDVTDMERMLDSFLEFARAERVEDPTITDPATLVTDLAHRMQVDVGRVDQGPPVPLRALGVARALQNLVSNAQSYGTNCRISLERSAKTLRFSVEDDGPGIPADKRDVAMQPFSRLDESRNLSNAPGVGLGLAIATDIARAHGGTLRLGESTDMGGLRADVILPI